MQTMTEESDTSRGRRNKVARLIEEYDLAGIGKEMEQLWTAEEDRRSLRDLAIYFNQSSLRRHLRRGTSNYLMAISRTSTVY